MKQNRLGAHHAVIVAVLLAFAFVLMGVWIRMMSESFGTFQQVYLRILIAGVLALVFFRNKFSKGLIKNLSQRDWSVYIVRSLMAYTVGVGAFTIAIQHAQLGTVSFISSLPILGLLSWILFRERLPVKSLPFVLLSVVGLLLVTKVNIHNIQFGVGELASIVGMLGFDIGYLMSRMHNKERNNYENTTILLLVGWIPLFALSILNNERLWPQHVTSLALIGLILSSIQNVIGLYAINYVFGNLKAYVAGNILLIEGFFAVIVGYLLYNEPLTLSLLLGGSIIVYRAFMINRIERDFPKGKVVSK